MSKHFVNTKYEPVNSLLTLCLDNIISHIETQPEELMLLPNHIKTRILKRLSSKTVHFANIKQLYKMLVHSQLKSIDLSSLEVDNDILNIISCCSNLRKLILTRSKNNILTESGLLQVLPNFQKLLVFHAGQCEAVSDAVVSALVKNCPQISEIDLDSCNISDEALFQLATLENLSALNISRTKVSSDSIIRLVEGSSGHLIKELRIAECKGVDHKAMHVICEKCTSLEVFIFYNCSEFKGTTCVKSSRSEDEKRIRNFKNGFIL